MGIAGCIHTHYMHVDIHYDTSTMRLDIKMHFDAFPSLLKENAPIKKLTNGFSILLRHRKRDVLEMFLHLFSYPIKKNTRKACAMSASGFRTARWERALVSPGSIYRCCANFFL